MRYGEIYLYRVRKPRARVGLPVLGRHNGYVGQTRNPAARHGEHMNGGGRYGKPAAPWSDLAPRRYVLFRMRHCPQWLLNLVERLAILLTWPVYNHLMNLWNPRRIPRYTAVAARAARELGHRSPLRFSPYRVAGTVLGLGGIYLMLYIMITNLPRG